MTGIQLRYKGTSQNSSFVGHNVLQRSYQDSLARETVLIVNTTVFIAGINDCPQYLLIERISEETNKN